MSTAIKDALSVLAAEKKETRKFVKNLSELDFFVLDNSIRESTVAQLRSHTLANKKAIFNTSKSLNPQGIIVASFNSMHRVDDEFAKWLGQSSQDFSKLWSFSEVTSGSVVNGVPTNTGIPSGLEKNKKYGLYNTLFEMDLADTNVAWDTKWSVADVCQLLEKRMEFVYTELNKNAKVLLNFRDIPTVMQNNPERCLAVVEYLAKMPKDRRMFGLVFEDPMGESLPAQLASWCKAIRSVMDANGWKDGRLLNHIHEKWELQTASTLACLANGGDGVWASVCTEGAVNGHASSTVTLTNLIRLGNKKVLTSGLKCKKFRQAAIDVTKITTMKMPHPKQPVYGERALDLVFGFLGVGDFNLGEFFGEHITNRMSTLASPKMITDRLKYLFGDNPQFTEEIGSRMKAKMLEDLNSNPPRKEEYQSAMGLAVLFDRCGGQLNEKMADVIRKVKLSDVHHQCIIDEIKGEWNNWDSREAGKSDDMLEFDSFYHGFLQPYFGCYRCPETKHALKSLDMDSDGYVDWKEFLVYIKWALREYPDTKNAGTVLEIAFQQGIMPAARDVKIRTPGMNSTQKHVSG